MSNLDKQLYLIADLLNNQFVSGIKSRVVPKLYFKGDATRVCNLANTRGRGRNYKIYPVEIILKEPIN